MKTLLGVLQAGTFVAAVCFSIWTFIKTKSYAKLIFTTWAACFICALANILLYPGILYFFGEKRIFAYGESFQSWGVIGLIGGFVLGVELAIIIFLGTLICRGFNKLFRKAKNKT